MNSAARLHVILTEVVDINAGVTRQAWAKVLGTDDDPVNVLCGLGQVAELLRQVERDITTMGGHDSKLHAQPLQDLAPAFRGLHLEEPWKQAKQRLDRSAIRALSFTADALRVVRGTLEVPPETLDSLRRSLEETTAYVLAADIDTTLKVELVRHLEQARRALLEYKVRGPDGLKDALDTNLGLVTRTVARSGPAEKSVLKRVWLFLGELDTALSLAGYGLQLAPPVTEMTIKLLSGGT